MGSFCGVVLMDGGGGGGESEVCSPFLLVLHWWIGFLGLCSAALTRCDIWSRFGCASSTARIVHYHYTVLSLMSTT